MSSANNIPATSTKTLNSVTGSAGTVKEQTDRFLKILLTQLQNQNPLEPMKPQEFSSQLAQFSALEQQTNTNTKLDTLISLSSSGSVSPLSYLGNTVDYDSPTVPVQAGKATWNYSAPGAASIDIAVRDAAGKTVYSGKGDLTAGPHLLALGVPEGTQEGTPLTISVVAKDASGKTIKPEIASRARIEAVDTSDGTTNLEAAGYKILASKVKRVIAPTSVPVQS